jgi:tetratricopeptide (TPR) repeat protein
MTALRLAAAMTGFWPVGLNDIGYLSNSVREWQALRSRALALPDALKHTAERAKALNASGLFFWSGMSAASPHLEIEEALAIGRELQDNSIIASSFFNLGLVENFYGNFARARSLLQQGLNLLQGSALENKTDYLYALMFLGDVALNQQNFQEARMYYEQCYAELKAMDDRNWLAYVARRLSRLACLRGDHDEATTCCRESLSVNLELGYERGVIMCLSQFAAIAQASGESVPAAHIFGAVSAQIRARNIQMLPMDKSEYERNVTTLHLQLDPAALELEWAKGAEMTLKQAMEYALEING